MIPTVAELRYFYEITKTLNLSHAAKKLHISQPSLSRSIQHLEKTVGTDLLIRHKKGVTLTPAGKKVLFKVKSLMDEWNTTRLEALASHQQVEGHIKIGCHPTTGLFIHEHIAELLNQYPKLDIELKHATSDVVTQQVIDVISDIGIVTNPIHYPDLIIHKLSEYGTTLWAATRNHKLQNIHSGEAVLICNPDTQHTEIILKQCRLAGMTFKRILNVNSIEVIANLTANGCGIGILPSCISKTLFDKKLKRVPDMPIISDELCLIYRKEFRNVKIVKAVADQFKRWPEKCLEI